MISQGAEFATLYSLFIVYTLHHILIVRAGECSYSVKKKKFFFFWGGDYYNKY